MLIRLRCVVPLFDRDAPRRIVALHDTRSRAHVQALDWPGVLLEAGLNDVVEVDDLSLAHHYLGVNAGRVPVRLEIKEQHGYRHVTLEPATGWFAPAGHAFSLRVPNAGVHEYVRIALDPSRFDRLVARSDDGPRPVALRTSYHISGPQIEHLVGALTAEARDGTPSGLAFVDALTTALGLQLVQQTGVGAPPAERARGGLAPAVRRRIAALIEAEPNAHLSIERLAREAALSPAHFARAFKESFGRAPHQHLMALRLERARRLLDEPEAALSDIAQRTGFADQAHFTRFFRRQFGITPGALVRSRRRGGTAA